MKYPTHLKNTCILCGKHPLKSREHAAQTLVWCINRIGDCKYDLLIWVCTTCIRLYQERGDVITGGGWIAHLRAHSLFIDLIMEITE